MDRTTTDLSISLIAATIARRVGELIVAQDTVRDAFSRRPSPELSLVEMVGPELFDKICAIADEELLAPSKNNRGLSPLQKLWLDWIARKKLESMDFVNES